MINICLVILSYFFMELVAWSNHKYVMHGILWSWHKDHHSGDQQNILQEKARKQRFEKNDLFFLFYALPAIVLLFTGFYFHDEHLAYVGIGITLYGFTYFVIHDIMIHDRIRIPFLQKKHNHYIASLLKAHAAHHWGGNKKDFRNFGLLVFPIRFFKK